MNAEALNLPAWRAAPDTDVALSALRTHFQRCNGCRGRWFALRCAIDAVHEFAAPRFVTTLLIAGTAIVAAGLLL